MVLESLFASAFMTLFSNLVTIDNASRLLDRFILCKFKNTYNLNIVGEKSIMDIMRHILRQKESEFIKMDCWDV